MYSLTKKIVNIAFWDTKKLFCDLVEWCIYFSVSNQKNDCVCMARLNESLSTSTEKSWIIIENFLKSIFNVIKEILNVC